MIIAVDFDGTIVRNIFPDIGEEIVPALDVLKQAQCLGHKIILWTCREGDDLKRTVDWLQEKNFIPDAVNENVEKDLPFGRHKVYADWYIDDRGMLPATSPNWEWVRRRIQKMGEQLNGIEYK